MTVGDEAQVGRPRMSVERKAKLGVEGWRLKDQGMSFRGIAAKFTKRGDEISHTQVARLVKEAQEASQFLDLVGPAETRANQLGYLDGAIEKTEAAIEAGDVDFEPGMKLLIQLIKLQKDISGSAMPSRLQVETTGDTSVPGLATIRACAAELDKWRHPAEATDGLETYDH